MIGLAQPSNSTTEKQGFCSESHTCLKEGMLMQKACQLAASDRTGALAKGMERGHNSNLSSL